MTTRFLTLSRVLGDRRGVTGLYFTLVIGTMMLLSLAALDMIRVHLVRSRLVTAADSAVLAAGGSLGEPPATWRAIGTAFFNANGKSALGETYTIKPADFVSGGNGGTTTLSLTFNADIPLLSGVFGTMGNMRFAVSNQAQRRSQAFELAMVLDNTGSMWTANDNIGALRTDAQILLNTLALNAVNGTLQNASVALVPYSTAVNAGAFAQNLLPGQTVGTGDRDWWGCLIEPSSPDTLQINAGSSADWLKYDWKSDTDNNYDTYGVFSDWDNGNGSTGPNLGCPKTPLTPLTRNVAALTAAISSMRPWSRGGTSSDIGMAWGLRALAPNGPIATGAPFNGATAKVLVLMTDGEAGYFRLGGDAWNAYGQLTNKKKSGVESDYGGYGRVGAYQQRLKATTKDQATTSINNNITTLCNLAKNTLGVQVYTITFGATGTTALTYQQCASDPAHYFNAPNQAALQTAFSTIGGALSELAITR